MKKSTLIASALLLAGACYTNAYADNGTEPNAVYVSGKFNEYNPNGESKWALTADVDEVTGEEYSTFRGTIFIPTGEFEFNMNYNGVGLVPAVNIDGQWEAAEQNETVVFDDGFYAANVATTGMTRISWVDPTWEEGYLEIVLDLETWEIALSKVDGPAEGDDNLSIYISGEFNSFDPDGNEIWQLGKTEEDGVFRGTFNIPAGGFAFRFVSDGFELVPATMVGDELEATTSDVNVLTDDTFFSGKFTSAGVGQYNWVNTAWEGGLVEVTVDVNNWDILISSDVQGGGEEGPEALYIAGEFNDYAPEGLEIWALDRTEAEGVYRGTFEIAEGKFSFHIVGDMITFVPGVEEDGEYVAADFNETVLDNDDFYMGPIAPTGVAQYNWVNDTWAGGYVEVTVDLNENMINISATDEPAGEGPEALYIAGEFNDYAPEGLEIWALSRTEAEGVYRGTFEIAEGKFSFHIVGDMITFVPGVEEDGEYVAAASNETVLDNDDFYMGPIAPTGVAQYNWVNDTWAGGYVEVTVDLNENMINISATDEPAVEGPELFIAGEFNDYAPEGLEIWALTGTGAEGVYRGTFEIPAGQFSFHIVADTFTLVPGVEEDGEYVAGEADVTVFVNDDFYMGPIAPTGVAKYNWVNENWEGGYVEVTVDLNENMINISATDEPGGEGPEALYIAGAFNDYAPEGLEIWALGKTEENGVYEGTFNVNEGQLSFYILLDTIALVPGVDEEGEYVATLEDVNVLGSSQTFTGNFASTGVAAHYWVNSNWTGGELGVTVNLNNNTITLKDVEGSGVKVIGLDNENVVIYNLNGVRVDRNNLDKGIYIVNGKKLVVK